MKKYVFGLTFELNDNSGNEEQYVKLRDTLLHLLKREDEEGNLLEGGFNHITGFHIDFPSVTKEQLLRNVKIT